MLLGALIGAGAPIDVLQSAVSAVVGDSATLRVEAVRRGGFAATRCHVEVMDDAPMRQWPDIREMITNADLLADVREASLRVFQLLAEAEGRVHGISAESVHFHEVGALDAIADIVGVCAGMVHLGIASLVISPVAVGSGSVTGAHGRMQIPGPAVVDLLRGVPTLAGPGSTELCTPTGAALLTAFAGGYGGQPAMSVGACGVGAGSRDPVGHANVVRLLVGVHAAGVATESVVPTQYVVETNVDDMDPRVWPDVLSALMHAGAADAWLTPILMKKGRPAHTLHALVAGEHVAAIRNIIFRQTSTIGIRESAVSKHALERCESSVDFCGHSVAVKMSSHRGEVLNRQVEYDDVVRAARLTGYPLIDVLDAVKSAARQQIES